jgi:hypothetical protein
VITLLKALLIENWQRKILSLILAMIIWIVLSHSITATKIIPNVPNRVEHIPPEKTIEGMQIGGVLKKKVTLTLYGNKDALDEISAKDLEVILDASGKSSEWTTSISKKHIFSLNPDFDVNKAVSRIAPIEISVKQSKLVTEKVPIHITYPIGEPPKGYQFLDIWPYQLHLNVTGPEDAVKRMKIRGLKLTFNLNDISKTELDTLQSNKTDSQTDEISFFVPNSWKKISAPLISENLIEIDDPQSNALRINFSREDLLPIGTAIPVTVFFPPKHSNTLNPETYTLATGDFIAKKNGIKMIQTPLYAQGVSRLFLDLVKDMIQVVIVAAPKSERDTLIWNAQFMYPHELEDRYVTKVMSEPNDELDDVQPYLREDYLRNRFRSYMTRFRLYTPNNKKLSLKIELQANTISVTPENYP